MCQRLKGPLLNDGCGVQKKGEEEDADAARGCRSGRRKRGRDGDADDEVVLDEGEEVVVATHRGPGVVMAREPRRTGRRSLTTPLERDGRV